MLDPDFTDMLSAFIDAGVEFLLIGGHALAVHGLPRSTKDMDLWVRPSPENAQRVYRALDRFGAPMVHVDLDTLRTPDMVIQIGVAPKRIDIVTGIAGVSFDEAWPGRIEFPAGSLAIPVIGREHLIRNKRATGRKRDAADADDLGNLTA